jgi:hypothetical protein
LIAPKGGLQTLFRFIEFFEQRARKNIKREKGIAIRTLPPAKQVGFQDKLK